MNTLTSKLLFTTLFLTCFSGTINAQETTTEKKRPVATYQVGSAKVIVWENKKKDGSTWKNYKIEKEYQTKDGDRKTSSSFNSTELLELKAVLEKAIEAEGIKEKSTE